MAYPVDPGPSICGIWACGGHRFEHLATLARIVPLDDVPIALRFVARHKSVQHMYPQLAEQEIAIKADKPRSYGPGKPVDLGHPSWSVGPPYGTDMVIAAASSEPLFSRPRPRNAEMADVYLRGLQAVINIPCSTAHAWLVPQRPWRPCHAIGRWKCLARLDLPKTSNKLPTRRGGAKALCA
jgi:hypothetical protein